MKRKLFIIVALLLLVLTSCYDIPGIPYYKLDIVDNGLRIGSENLHIITISSEKDFDKIYYTLDTSAPSSSSQLYSPSVSTGADLNTYYGIVISEGTTIKAIGYRGEQGSFIAEITIPSCSHKWDDGDITTKPTCMAKGEKTYTCTACGQIMKVPLAITDHAWDSGEIIKAPTCTASGKKTYTCTVCGETKTEAINATGHSWNSGAVTTEPGCTTTGVRTYTCSKCNGTRTETIEATGHSWDSGAVTTEPGCTTAGVRTYTCSACGGTKTETIEATGHSWNSGEVTTEPGCTTAGVRTYTCTKCNETRTESIPAEHAYVNYKCSNCGLWGKGPAGGYVFYDCDADNDSGNADGLISTECGWRYLEAASTDLSYKDSSGITVMAYTFGYYRTSSWSSNSTIGTKQTTGSGKTNTESLVNAMGETTYTSSSGTKKGIYAAKACVNYSVTIAGVVYDDWFLPSKSELNLMYTNLHKNGEGSFADSVYWSSSEISSDSAWRQYFYNGYQLDDSRIGSYRVRPVRAF